MYECVSRSVCQFAWCLYCHLNWPSNHALGPGWQCGDNRAIFSIANTIGEGCLSHDSLVQLLHQKNNNNNNHLDFVQQSIKIQTYELHSYRTRWYHWKSFNLALIWDANRTARWNVCWTHILKDAATIMIANIFSNDWMFACIQDASMFFLRLNCGLIGMEIYKWNIDRDCNKLIFVNNVFDGDDFKVWNKTVWPISKYRFDRFVTLKSMNTLVSSMIFHGPAAVIHLDCTKA